MKKLREGVNPRAVLTLPAGAHTDGDGLRLQVGKGGGRSWVVNYRINGVRREMGLGSPPDVSLAQARAEARKVREEARKGVDLRRAREEEEAAQAAAAADTFGAFEESYRASRRIEWVSERTAKSWENSLVRWCKSLADKPLSEITRDDVLAVVQPRWNKNPVLARNTRKRIELVLDAATVMGRRSGPNPARWEGHLKSILFGQVEPESHASLPAADAPAFMQRLRSCAGMGALALELTILTGVRSAETYGAQWSEIDLDAAIWSIPLDRVKARKAFKRLGWRCFRVPLSDAAVAVLRKAKEGRRSDDPDAWVFPGYVAGKAISSATMERVIDRLKEPVTVHGFRSTLREWAGARTVEVEGEIVAVYSDKAIELSLGHVPGTRVSQAYDREDRLEERRRIVNAWATYLAGAQVIALRPRGGGRGRPEARRA